MAEKLIRISDLSGEHGAEQHRFEVDGATCDIDLTAAEYEELILFLAAYYGAGRTGGRKVPGLRDRAGGGMPGPPPDLTPKQRQDVRAYIRSIGQKIGDNGRVSYSHLRTWEDAGRPSRDELTTNGHALS